MDNIWNELYEAAKAVLKPRAVSKFVEAGGVAAAIESGSGKIYTGVCVDTACTLGICAERNAIFHMLAEGEDTVRRVIAISSAYFSGGSAAQVLQICAAWPLPENFSFALYSPQTLQ